MANEIQDPLKKFYNTLKNDIVLARRYYFVLSMTDWDPLYNSIIKDVNVPGITLNGAPWNNITEITDIATSYTFVAPGTYTPSRKEFEIKFLDNEYSVVDNIFYPWMLKCLNTDLFKDDYSKDITIAFYNNKFKTKDLVIKILAAYPITCDLPSASHENKGIYERGVTLRCDNILINTPYLDIIQKPDVDL